MGHTPVLSSTVKGQHIELAASGSWTAPYAGELEPLIKGASTAAG